MKTMTTIRNGRAVQRARLLGALCCAGLLAAAGHAESLFKDKEPAREQNYKALIADNKAYRKGDILTVQVFENTNAISSADTGTRRNNNLSANISHANGVAGQTSLAVGGDFGGGGKTQRTNQVVATVSVTVREILPNGDLKIGGEQLITVNREPQKTSLEGRVRPADISDGNTVLSTRIADLKITNVGEGDIAERGKLPWWRRLLDSAGF